MVMYELWWMIDDENLLKLSQLYYHDAVALWPHQNSQLSTSVDQEIKRIHNQKNNNKNS